MWWHHSSRLRRCNRNSNGERLQRWWVIVFQCILLYFILLFTYNILTLTFTFVCFFIFHSEHLTNLHLEDLPELESLPDQLPSLTGFVVVDCPKVVSIPAAKSETANSPLLPTTGKVMSERKWRGLAQDCPRSQHQYFFNVTRLIFVKTNRARLWF